jgi:DNA repair protein RadC
VAGGEILGIRVLDHVIFSGGGYRSMLQHGEMEATSNKVMLLEAV